MDRSGWEKDLKVGKTSCARAGKVSDNIIDL